jgi:SagB-type dehydrogenase family enzyme
VIPLDDTTALSLLFHLNSEPWLNEAAYAGRRHRPPSPQSTPVLTEVVLPTPAPGALDGLLRLRRSGRRYLAETLPLPALAALLHSAYGMLEAPGPGVPSGHRPVPSAGGLFPLDLYVFTRRVEGVADGLHLFDPLAGTVGLVRAGDVFGELEPVMYAYPFIAGANVVVALAATFARTQAKYGPRGYRYILIEAGHVGQNVSLRAAELGLSSLCMGGFVDSELNALVGLDPTRAGIVYAIGIGVAPPGPEAPTHGPDGDGRSG